MHGVRPGASADPISVTSEGLDTALSLSYYSRMRAITNLLPLLMESPGGTVVSVINPKLEKKLRTDDLGLRQKGNFAIRLALSHAAHMTTFFMEAVAARHPGKLSLIHYFPGMVMTDLAYKSPIPGVVKMLWRYIMAPISKRRAIPLEECGARSIFLTAGKFAPQGSHAVGADGRIGSGAYRVDFDGETLPLNEDARHLREGGIIDMVWDHTMKTFDEIQTQGKLV